MSAATINRLLASERKKYNLKGRSQTKPGTLTETYRKLNPAQLKRDVTGLQRKLDDLAIRKEKLKEGTQVGRARTTVSFRQQCVTGGRGT